MVSAARGLAAVKAQNFVWFSQLKESLAPCYVVGRIAITIHVPPGVTLSQFLNLSDPVSHKNFKSEAL